MGRDNNAYLDLTKADFIVHGSLDEMTAYHHFFGKSLEEAEALFQKNAIFYEEDLWHMGRRAFCYYFEAFVTYIESPASMGDSDCVNCFAGMLEFRLKHEREQIAASLPRLAQCCYFVLKHWGRYEVDEDIYGDLRGRYRELCDRLTRA